jgi:hypothetical protein
MQSPNLIKTLRRRYARTLGLVEAGEDVAKHKANLEHLEAVMLMFHPDEKAWRIAPIRPHANRRGEFKRPVWYMATLAVMREAGGPLTARQIAEKVLAARGEALDGPEAVSAHCSILAALRRRVGREVVRVEGWPRRWMLAHRVGSIMG